MDTQALRLFVMAADMLNISAAGRLLGLAPAVASARLAKLEHQIGSDLLHRSTRKVSLSLDGAEFLPYAREILAQEDAALAALGRGETTVSGTLRFAASSTFAQAYIIPILPAFLKKYPAIDLDLRLSDMQMDLIEGGYDLALRNFAIKDSSLRARKLADDTRILCASPGYLKEYGFPQSPEDLRTHQLIVFADNTARDLVNPEKGERFSFPPENSAGRVICNDGSSTREASKADVGISMNSLWSVHQDLKDGSLVRVFPDWEIDDQSAIWLVYPKSNVLTAKVRVFIDYLVDQIGTPPVWLR